MTLILALSKIFQSSVVMSNQSLFLLVAPALDLFFSVKSHSYIFKIFTIHKVDGRVFFGVVGSFSLPVLVELNGQKYAYCWEKVTKNWKALHIPNPSL